ncbi:hypothetical protein M3Y97_00791400 [Aphelenchoides bicaudatus]|nr:hypothetical protein M3Y97_00791400 [Aphelenchoides bicaudatus]
MLACRFARNGLRPIQFKSWKPLIPLHVSCRPSTSGVINHVDHIRLENENDARTLINHLKPNERKLLLSILKESSETESSKSNGDDGTLNSTEVRQLFIFNTLPFVGEYIDQSLGAALAISTMAAAALGNIISDVAGVGLAHYIEFFVNRLGVKHPVLTAAQLESSKARFTVNMARAIGLTVGCFIGILQEVPSNYDLISSRQKLVSATN